MLAGCGVGFAVQQFKEGTAAGKLTEAWKKAGFELWIVKNNKTYRDEEEKAMRFQLFKAAVESIEPHRQEKMPPEVSCFADFTQEERRKMLANPDRIGRTEYNAMLKSHWAKQEEKRRAAAMDAQP